MVPIYLRKNLKEEKSRSKDVVIGIGIDKCPHQTYAALKYAKEKINAPTICIIDSLKSPLNAQSQHSLLINSTNSMYFGSMIGAFSIGNTLFNTIATLQKSATKDHFKFFREMSAKNKTYL